MDAQVSSVDGRWLQTRFTPSAPSRYLRLLLVVPSYPGKIAECPCSWNISRRVRLSHPSVIDIPLLAMANSSKSPIPGSSDNTLSSSKIDSQGPRTIILCFDGTGNKFCESVRRSAATKQHRSIIDPVEILQNTNVVKLFSILKKDVPTSQVCYYQVSTHPSTFCPSLHVTERLALAWYRDLH